MGLAPPSWGIALLAVYGSALRMTDDYDPALQAWQPWPARTVVLTFMRHLLGQDGRRGSSAPPACCLPAVLA